MSFIIDIIEDTIIDGPGFRTVIHTVGCLSKHPGCHNPESRDIHKGKKVRTGGIVGKVLAGEFASATPSGGDPMFQSEGFTEVAKAIRTESQKTIRCYTGYKFEDLIKNPAQAILLLCIDVLVDGRYKQTPRNESLLFQGSSNQRLIDVQTSLNKKEIVTCRYNPFI